MNLIPNIQFHFVVLFGMFIPRNTSADTIKVTRIKDGGDTFKIDSTTAMSCLPFGASDACKCLNDKVFSEDPSLSSNKVGCYSLEDCSLTYLKKDKSIDVRTEKYSTISKVEFLNLNSMDLKQGVWIDLTNHARRYMEVKRDKLVEATTEKFAGQVMKVTMSSWWGYKKCVYLVGPGEITYPYDFNQLFRDSITTTTKTTKTTPTTPRTTTTATTTPTTTKTTTKATTMTTTASITTLTTSTKTMTTKRTKPPTTPTSMTASSTTDHDVPTNAMKITTTTTRGILPDSIQKTSDDKGGLSIGLYVGIAIICVVAIALAVITSMLYCKRRSGKQNKSTIENPTYANGRVGCGIDAGISNTIYLTPTAPGGSASVLYDDAGNKSRSGSMHSLVSTSTTDSPQRSQTQFTKNNTYLDVPKSNMVNSSQEDDIYLTPLDTDGESHYSDVPTGSYTNTYAELEEHNNVTGEDDDEHIYREVYADPQAEYATPIAGANLTGGNYQSLNFEPTSGSSNMYQALRM